MWEPRRVAGPTPNECSGLADKCGWAIQLTSEPQNLPPMILHFPLIKQIHLSTLFSYAYKRLAFHPWGRKGRPAQRPMDTRYSLL
jgi:hypothetical protein